MSAHMETCDLPMKRQRVATSEPVQIPSCLPATCHTRNRYLDRKHGHPRDRHIFFDDGEKGELHDYYVDWNMDGHFDKTACISVTTLIHTFFPPFDRAGTVRKIKQNCKPSSKYYGMLDAEIYAQWEQAGLEARTYGNMMHDFIDRFMNGERQLDPKVKEQLKDELRLFHKALQLTSKWVPFRTEWFVYTDRCTRITGSLDCVFVNQPLMDLLHKEHNEVDVLHLIIYDWKRCKQIRKFSPWAQGRFPVHTLPSANFYHYSLQLNMYKWILETFYTHMPYRGRVYQRIHVDFMYLCVLHPNLKEPNVVRCPDFSIYVERITSLRKQCLTNLAQGLPAPYPFDLDQPVPEEALEYYKSLEKRATEPKVKKINVNFNQF